MIYRNEDLLELQKIETEILAEIIRICELYKLKYFTIAGTTLGAIRHNGFIPWDDDIDVGLVRKDYDKFLEIAPKELKCEFFLQHYNVESRTPCYHAKVMKRGTQFVEEYAKNIKIDHGIFVDIMPFDYIPCDEKSLIKYRHNVWLFHQLYIAKSVCKTSITKGKKKFPYAFLRTCLHILLLPIPKDYLFNKLQKFITEYNSCPTGRLSSRGLRTYECDEDDIFPTISHVFSDLEVNIPGNFDKILTQRYGDYMKLPNIHDRVGHQPLILKF